jgi:hypothetical protein
MKPDGLSGGDGVVVAVVFPQAASTSATNTITNKPPGLLEDHLSARNQPIFITASDYSFRKPSFSVEDAAVSIGWAVA